MSAATQTPTAHSVTIKKRILSLVKFASKDETRANLCGVYHERPEGETPSLMVATNGHFLAMLEAPEMGDAASRIAFPVGLFVKLGSVNGPISAFVEEERAARMKCACGGTPAASPAGGAPFAYAAVCPDCYDGAPDAPQRNQVGLGNTEAEALLDLEEKTEQ